MTNQKEDTTSPVKRYQRSTMRDVAALADVSPKTVSRVINGEKYVSAEIVERVHAAMERLDYRHNLAASQLRAGTTSAAIGLILVDISNPFSSMLHRAVEDVFRTRGIAVLSASTDEDAARERAAVATFAARRVDGLIMMPASHDHSYLSADVRAGTHIVLIDRPPAFLNVDSVVSDNLGGAETGVRHLISHGHRQIGFIGDWPGVVSSQLRYDGYRRALETAGIPIDDSLVARGFSSSADVEETSRALLLRSGAPTALFVAQNALCAAVIRAIRTHGAHDRVAIVGFDGFEGADLIEPGLTVITQDPLRMGTLAAETLVQRMSGASTTPAMNHVLPTVLIERGSGELPGPFAA
ncbi:LacI family DNA-binding transcriptional regulator [Dactylosporangium sp. NPDC051485]|uniref:LacI family DNA-binding transcriptional regulator n=1 Tax=Dactylosporangium sp. NPDC051485 TaxID=3154846 RepID=UPI0034366064